MKKKFFIIFCTLLASSFTLFAQTNATVNIYDDVYKVLDISESRGLCSTLKLDKPYSQHYILNKLDEIKESLLKEENTKINKTELQIVQQHIDRFSRKETSIPELEFTTSNSKDDLPLYFGFHATIEGMVSGGLYSNKDNNSVGFEEWDTLGVFGDLGKYFSFDWDGGIALSKMSLTKMPTDQNGKEYYIGPWWNKTGYVHPDENDDTYKRYIKTFKNYSVLPYHYIKHWDGSIYDLENFTATGLTGWPNVLSFGMTMQGGIYASFFNDRLSIDISRKNREWGAMDFEASLALNAKARPFLGIGIYFKPFDWFSISNLTGFLEYPNQDYINSDAWYILNDKYNGSNPEDKKVWQSPLINDSYYFQNLYSINSLNFDFKYFHFDFGSTVVFPKRFEFGYMFPIFEKVVYQNNVGDYDNLGLYTSIMGRYPGLGSVWFSAFIDEINKPSADLFKSTRCMFSYQTGLKTIFPLIPFGKMSFRYTKVEPFCYTHNAVQSPYNSYWVSTAYMNNGSSIGYYLDPNSDEFLFRLEGTPLMNFDIGFQYQLIRHGTTWGPGAVEGSSLYSELELTNDARQKHEKYFLRDGVYEWTNMLICDGSYDMRGHGLPMQFTFELGYIYTFYTQSGSYNKPANYSLVDRNNNYYPSSSGAVLSVGFKFFSF